eukprot:gi/632987909/ref/XP_007882819.1/ PREDICTED: LOW QUALITY PROTEIN: 7SK snRNA methylphosphate capping enzyme [Callorhinchus milii]
MKKLVEMSVEGEPEGDKVGLLKPEFLAPSQGGKAEVVGQGGPVSQQPRLGLKDELGGEEESGGGGGGGGGGAGGGVVVVARPRNGIQPLQQQQQRAYKRRNTFNVGFKHPGSKRRRRANSDCDPVLPSNFLLGGNIFDPLNLNSLLDEDVNKALNAETPKSSPLPSRNRDPVEILIPKDITDPLSLNSGNDSEVLPSPLKVVRKRRHRHYHHAGSPSSSPPPSGQAADTTGKAPGRAAPHPPTAAATAAPPQDCPAKENVSAGGEPQEGPQPYELNTVINCRDEIVSPVLRGAEAGGGPGSGSGSRHRKRRRTTSRSEAVKPGAGGATEEQQQRAPGSELKKTTPEKGKGKASQHHHHHHHHQNSHRPPGPGKDSSRNLPNFKSKQKKFQYGNYSKYYGYRNPGRGEDPRLCVLKPHWFSGKDVLDLGCNSGHVTLSIAKHLKPSRIVGLDIDGALVHTARQNIRHFLSQDLLPPRGPGQAPRQFPLSLTKCKGPIAAPPVCLDASGPEFPNNVVFFQGNYVLETDELLDTQKPEYDVILCLSLTKWVHLNWGDEGLKRMFKRIYRHLRPGGIFLLEPQPWSSYGKRRKLTETIYRNYFKISLKPEQFTSFLLSSEVGFCSYELVGTPLSTSKGFQRPVYLFHKSRPSSSSN